MAPDAPEREKRSDAENRDVETPCDVRTGEEPDEHDAADRRGRDLIEHDAFLAEDQTRGEHDDDEREWRKHERDEPVAQVEAPELREDDTEDVRDGEPGNPSTVYVLRPRIVGDGVIVSVDRGEDR